jgi:hypothetical protein
LPGTERYSLWPTRLVAPALHRAIRTVWLVRIASPIAAIMSVRPISPGVRGSWPLSTQSENRSRRRSSDLPNQSTPTCAGQRLTAPALSGRHLHREDQRSPKPKSVSRNSARSAVIRMEGSARGGRPRTPVIMFIRHKRSFAFSRANVSTAFRPRGRGRFSRGRQRDAPQPPPREAGATHAVGDVASKRFLSACAPEIP